MNYKVILLVLVSIAALVAGYAYMTMQQTEPETAATPAPMVSPESTASEDLSPSSDANTATEETSTDLSESTASVEEAMEPKLAPVPIVEAPTTLENSDDVVKQAVGDLSQGIVESLTPDALIQKWVMLVKNAADGKVVVKNRPVDLKVSPYVVDETDDVLRVGDNTERAQQIVNTITEIDVQLLARYYKAWLPTFESAYKELGEAGSFDSKFQQTIVNVLNTDPYAAKDAQLVRPSVYYKFSDERLEKASPLEKSLWRLGPENTLALQKFLRKLRAAIQS